MDTKPTQTNSPKTETNPSQSSTAAAAAVPATPFRLKHILVPIDFSACSKKALAYASSFARQFGAELTLLHVVQPFTPVPEMPPVDFETINEAKAELDAVQGTVGNGVVSKALLCSGQAHSEIARASKELDIDLIVISTHGRTGLARALMGSTTEKVVRLAHCPVLVVREFEHEFIAE
jgi:universal stress protein A